MKSFEVLLSIATDAGDKATQACAYANLAVCVKCLGDPIKAIEFSQQALSIAKQVGSKDLEGPAYINLGDAHSSLSDFKKAIEYYQQGLGIAKQVGNKDLEGTAYGNLGNAYNSLSDFKKAIEYHLQALSIAKQMRNKTSEGKAYVDLGLAHKSLSDFKKAIEYCEQGLVIAKQVGNKALEGVAYINLGIAHKSLSDFKKAIEYYQQALTIAKQLGNKESEGKAYINLGNAYKSLSDFKKAMEYHQQALNIAKQVGNKDSEGKVYINLGNAYSSLGDFKKAIEYYQQSLSIAKQVGNKDSEGNAYGNLGDAHCSLSDFKQAVECYQRGLSIAKQVGNKDLQGKTYMGLGIAYRSLSDFKKAIQYNQHALRIAKQVENKASEGKVYTNLGNAHYSLSEFEEAVDYHQQALCIAKQVESKASEGMALMNLGNAYFSLGDFEKAVECYQQGLSIAKQVGNKASEGMAYGNLGNAHKSLRDFEKAIECYQQTVSIAKQVGDKTQEGKACANLGHVYCALNNVSVAEDFYKSSVRLFDETRALLKTNDEWKIGLRNQYDQTYRKLWFVQLQQKKTEKALCTAERGRAQALMDLMESEYCVKSVQPDSDEHFSSVSKYLTSMTVFLAEASNSVNFWVLQKGQPCQFVQRAISEGLESLTHKAYKHIGVFKKVMCEDRSWDEPVDEDSEEVSDRNLDEKEFTSEQGKGDPLKVLSDVLIGPISHLIQGDEVVIVPDAALFLVPYAALVDQQFRYLSETLRIRLAPTLTSLKLMAECPKEYHSTSGALVVGDPLVKDVRIDGKRVKQLPAAKQEVEMIGTILSITPLTGENATKAEVLNKLNSVALVHIAAHGQAKTGEIILCPNPDGPNKGDFILRMADVLKVKLRAKLAVLSCCHSGRGKIKAEGVVGLARAFLGAGARSVLASLWAIDDKATLEFMRYFYEHLVNGQSAGKALNQAMKRMRQSDDFSDVKYWAPFVLIGDDVTLKFGELR